MRLGGGGKEGGAYVGSRPRHCSFFGQNPSPCVQCMKDQWASLQLIGIIKG